MVGCARESGAFIGVSWESELQQIEFAAGKGWEKEHRAADNVRLLI